MGRTQANAFIGKSERETATQLLGIVTPIAKKYGLLPSVATAQCILESGYCKTDLALNANNVCGMKCSLSGNTWEGSTWDGRSKYTKRTAEDDGKGNLYYITADFRSYPTVEDSIADRCAYLLGARNGSEKRYKGIQDCKDYKSQVQLIKNGGYATDTKYVDKICSIIERFDLAVNDAVEEPVEEPAADTAAVVESVGVRELAGEERPVELRERGRHPLAVLFVRLPAFVINRQMGIRQNKQSDGFLQAKTLQAKFVSIQCKRRLIR